MKVFYVARITEQRHEGRTMWVVKDNGKLEKGYMKKESGQQNGKGSFRSRGGAS